MKRCRIAAMVIAAAVSSAEARNVIREWTGDHTGDYRIESMPIAPYDDVAVIITGNSHPDKVWKFEAWNDVEDLPGYINAIRIESASTVGGIQLSVIGQPPHVFGAAQLKSLDLKTNGDATNTIDTIRISGDFGALGPMWVYDVGTISIGGSVRSGISVAERKTVGGLSSAVVCGLRTS